MFSYSEGGFLDSTQSIPALKPSLLHAIMTPVQRMDSSVWELTCIPSGACGLTAFCKLTSIEISDDQSY